ncbi:hypothetical protein Ciccas_007407 [Cichlidogyrus casuarinus]|uniref:Uncharacterized protein n=1 Tax=Cichlidogyrus casuarinus TaxID=1844966 RepID=A0ABD2Q6Y6_9PLAT
MSMRWRRQFAGLQCTFSSYLRTLTLAELARLEDSSAVARKGRVILSFGIMQAECPFSGLELFCVSHSRAVCYPYPWLIQYMLARSARTRSDLHPNLFP